MTSSLCVLLDGSSYTTDLTKSTSQSSKLSRTFLFDQELLKSNVYQRGFRSLLKRSIRRKVQQDSTSSTNESLSSWRLSEDQFSKEQAAKSRTIDRFIIRDYVAQRQTSTCLLLNINEDDDEKKWFLAQLKLEDEGGLTPSQIDFYRPLIEQAAFKFALTWARQNSFHEKYKDREFSIFYLCKTCQLKSLDTTDLYLAANAFARLMACPSAKRIVERQLCDLHWAFS